MAQLLFPHDTIRPSQQPFIEAVTTAVQQKKNLIIHAPTGLGKTAAAIAPALTQAIDNDQTIFFLTSRHTQHDIAIKTLEAIRDKHDKAFQAVDVIGKKWMCLQAGVQRLPNQEFTEFCRALREDGKCDYYNKLKKGEKLTTEGKLTIETLSRKSPVRNQQIITTSEEHGVCPYYASMELSKKAKVIIGDYFYIFHPRVREQFFSKSENELEDAIIIVDEAHNLPMRIKDLATSKVSNIILKRAHKEAQKRGLHEIANLMDALAKKLQGHADELRKNNEYEMPYPRIAFEQEIKRYGDYEDITQQLNDHADAIREENKVSFLGAVAQFMDAWKGAEEGYTRILSRRKGLREEVVTLAYRCLDPSLIAKPIIDLAHSTILMSGTLTPTNMYRSVLGVQDAEEHTYPSPFPQENRMNLIIPKTSTKYTSRGEAMYRQMAQTLVEVVRNVPGNTAVFFPSYYLLQEVRQYFETETEKTVFCEQPEMNTSEKQEFIDRFRRYKDTGAVLLGAITGSFGEGIDLPGDELKAVVIVGLPLQKPDLETKALIDYYDEKYAKGWDYGYLFPAFNKTLQSAGRCIRSEKDRGVIIFLDERYAWPNYKRCFPTDWKIQTSLLYEQMIKEFFEK